MSTQPTKNYLNVKLKKSDTIICLDNLRIIDLRSKDEAPSLLGIYFEYYDGKDFYACASDIGENNDVTRYFGMIKQELDYSKS